MTEQVIPDDRLHELICGLFAGWLEKSPESPLMMRATHMKNLEKESGKTSVEVVTFSGLRHRISVEYLGTEE